MEKEIRMVSPLGKCIALAQGLARAQGNWLLTPEHLLYVIVMLPAMREEVRLYSVMEGEPYNALRWYIAKDLPALPEYDRPAEDQPLEQSADFGKVMENALLAMEGAGKTDLTLLHWLKALLDTEGIYGGEVMNTVFDQRPGKFMAAAISLTDVDKSLGVEHLSVEGLVASLNDENDDDSASQEWHNSYRGPGMGSADRSEGWKNHVVCINNRLEGRNPLVGREAELERTIQVLCRKDKNNPLHLGEPGVGKTALIYGLARMIEEGRVPERLKGAKIYEMDMGSMIAGTQYRGDFEEKIKAVLEGAVKEGNAIIYIDEIHTLMGAGAVGNGSLDASNMLKKYLEDDRIRFIGATTYDEFKRTVQKDKAVSRRFQEIDVAEPSEWEAIGIIAQLLPYYAEYHNVDYKAGVEEFAVRMSRRHIHGRYLPDKAIDLIDEAGAYRELHPADDGSRTVDTDLIAEVLARVCKVDALAMKAEAREFCVTLTERLLSHVYGQDKAVRNVAEAVLMSQAGLIAEHKPMGSFLFVGPTGVGKTELAKTLAKELGIGLVRFDMSEYAEKHTVAKLIGSPAGYVGYDDGGLLTDAIRKTPNCVLLLDELEKAHPDIYNILLQVMDYATLTDNQGRAADFSNVILIMTSNAGAQYASQARVGFGSSVSSGEAMMKEVKRVFKPEFLNRLTGIEVFNDMDRKMARLILEKALRELHEMLKRKKIKLSLSEEAKEWLLDKGFTRQYGARELERVISAHLKKPISHEILFGSLTRGGHVSVDVKDGKIEITPGKGDDE